MKNNNYKRNRNRSQSRRGGNGHANGKGNSFDSSGPEIRVRGSAIQVNEKYMALGNDAYLSGDRIQAESYYQHAEHYFRVYISLNGGVDPRKSKPENGSDLKHESTEKLNTKSDDNRKNVSDDISSKVETFPIIEEEKVLSKISPEKKISEK